MTESFGSSEIFNAGHVRAQCMYEGRIGIGASVLEH
jgi:hypothetical protein